MHPLPRVACLAVLLIGAAMPSMAQTTPPTRAVANTSPEAAIAALVRPLDKAGLLNGVLLVARGDKVVFQRAYGFASWELRVPNSVSSRFGIGSITKDMTRIMIDDLVSEGRLDIDAPVSRYLSGFPSGPRGGIPTVRQLIEHKAGVPWRVTTAAEETVTQSPADMVALAEKKGLLFEPGSKELYSSAGYSCLARIIELVEQLPFDSVLARRIFRPASMSGATDETTPLLMSRRAMPYLLGVGSGRLAAQAAAYEDLHFLVGAGSVYATATDLLHFIRSMRAGVFGAKAQRQFADSAGTWRYWYGRNNGYEASVDYLPERDLTFVFLTNLQEAATQRVRQQVKAILSGKTPLPSFPLPPPVAPLTEDLTGAIGFYKDPDDPVEVARVGGRMLRDGNEFYPIGGGKYYLPASGGILHFVRRADGTVASMATVWLSGETADWPKVR